MWSFVNICSLRGRGRANHGCARPTRDQRCGTFLSAWATQGQIHFMSLIRRFNRVLNLLWSQRRAMAVFIASFAARAHSWLASLSAHSPGPLSSNSDLIRRLTCSLHRLEHPFHRLHQTYRLYNAASFNFLFSLQLPLAAAPPRRPAQRHPYAPRRVGSSRQWPAQRR